METNRNELKRVYSGGIWNLGPIHTRTRAHMQTTRKSHAHWHTLIKNACIHVGFNRKRNILIPILSFEPFERKIRYPHSIDHTH